MSDYTKEAYAHVAGENFDNAFAVYEENLYAPHVTEEDKLQDLSRRIEWARRVKNGYCDSLAVAQRLHYFDTGEMVAILP